MASPLEAMYSLRTHEATHSHVASHIKCACTLSLAFETLVGACNSNVTLIAVSSCIWTLLFELEG